MHSSAPPHLNANHALFLDFDGTLAEIVATPSMTTISRATLAVLSRLAATLNGAVAIVSGRQVEAVDRMVAPHHFRTAGEHGLALRAGERGAPNLLTEDTDALDALRRDVTALKETHPTLLLEFKSQSIAAHYRESPEIGAAVESDLAQLSEKFPQFRLQRGKMVCEIRLAGADKGTAIQHYMAQAPFKGRVPVFVGDDVTDEAGFAAVNALGGISVKIGAGETLAQWRLKDVSAVQDWLADSAVRLKDPSGRTALPTFTSSRRLKQKHRLIVVSNRVAVPDGKREAGGLAVALQEAIRARDSAWIGWSGNEPGLGVKPRFTSKRKTGNASRVHTATFGRTEYVTLDFSRDERENYYNGFCNGALWPVCHFDQNRMFYEPAMWDSYRAVTARFGEQVAAQARDGDLIWAHDYHLMLLAADLRIRGLTQRMGFFLHIPFPTWNVFSTLPYAAELIEGLCKYDSVGFQTRVDAKGFVGCVTACLPDAIVTPTERGGFEILLGARAVQVDAFPISIDVQAMQDAAHNARERGLVRDLPRGKLILGVDRLDYTKGLPQRLRAYRHFLEHYPDYREEVNFIQIAPLSRAEVREYRELHREVNELAGTINAEYGRLTWVPIRYINTGFGREKLAGFYSTAQVGFVTPLRDGMNLVAKEYVACQNPLNPGVLVLSRFAGAAQELDGALLVNPNNIAEMADALARALEMPLAERRERHRRLLATLRANDVSAWAEACLAALAGA